MNQIKLNGTAVGRDVAEHAIKAQRDEIARLEKSIADLQAQLDAPEVEFWEGQIIETDTIIAHLFEFSHMSFDGKYCVCKNGDSLLRDNCRPLQDPLILQFKPHKPGDPMPCDGELRVHTLQKADGVATAKAKYFDWGPRDNGTEIIGWMPAAGWGRSE